ncbi:MAG: hypothetical protein ABWK01_09845 [Infirmifilum sp.]
MSVIDSTRPVRLSLIPRYIFPLLIMGSCATGIINGIALYIPLILLGLYSLFSLELGWSERFFTLGFYVYVLALYTLGFSTLMDAVFLASLIVAPINLVTVEVERLFYEYRLTRSSLEIRGIRQNSFLPRLTVQHVPLYLINEVKLGTPFLARLFKLKYVNVYVCTPTGPLSLRGVSQGPFLETLSQLVKEVSLPHVTSKTATLHSAGKGFDVKGSFELESAREPLARFYQFLMYFTHAFNATLSLSSGDRANWGDSTYKLKSADDTLEQKEGQRKGKMRNRIERLL